MQKWGNVETAQIRQIRLYSQQTTHSILFNSTLITLRRSLLAGRLLSLSVLNLTTHLQYSEKSLTQEQPPWTSWWSPLSGLSSSEYRQWTYRRRLSAPWRTSCCGACSSQRSTKLNCEWTGKYLSLLVVASPGDSPSNAGGLLLLLVQRADLAVEETHGLGMSDWQLLLPVRPCEWTYHRVRGKSCTQRKSR